MFGNASTPVVDSCQCMAKPIQYCTVNKVKIKIEIKKNGNGGTSSVVQLLRLQALNAGGPCLIPGQGTRSHMLQLRPSTDKYINIYFLQLKKIKKFLKMIIFLCQIVSLLQVFYTVSFNVHMLTIVNKVRMEMEKEVMGNVQK